MRLRPHIPVPRTSSSEPQKAPPPPSHGNPRKTQENPRKTHGNPRKTCRNPRKTHRRGPLPLHSGSLALPSQVRRARYPVNGVLVVSSKCGDASQALQSGSPGCANGRCVARRVPGVPAARNIRSFLLRPGVATCSGQAVSGPQRNPAPLRQPCVGHRASPVCRACDVAPTGRGCASSNRCNGNRRSSAHRRPAGPVSPQFSHSDLALLSARGQRIAGQAKACPT